MSAGSTVRGSSGTDSKPDIERVRALCAEALENCDALNLPPEIGARIQETISALEQFLKSEQSKGTSG
jgi:hypothetical protein